MWGGICGSHFTIENAQFGLSQYDIMKINWVHINSRWSNLIFFHPNFQPADAVIPFLTINNKVGEEEIDEIKIR